MGRNRSLPALLRLPTHSAGMKPCVVTTEVAVQTIKLPEGHFASLVIHQPGSPTASVMLIDQDELDPLVQLLRNALEDAALLDAGKPPRNADQSDTRH